MADSESNEQLAKSLWQAVHDGDEGQVKSLLQAGADPDHQLFWSKESLELPPLHTACAEDKLEIVELLTNFGHADLNSSDKSGMTPIHYACRALNKAIVSYLLTIDGCDIGRRDADDNLPMWTAMTTSQTDADDCTLDIVRMIGAKSSDDDRAAVLFECVSELEYESSFYMDVAKLLVEEFSVNPAAIRNREGQSLLDVMKENLNEALGEDEVDMMIFLLHHGCNSEENKAELLFIACDYGNLQLLQTLVEEHKFNPKGVQRGYETALDLALFGLGTIYDKDLSTGVYLIDHGFDAYEDKVQLLCAACEWSNLDVTKQMIEKHNISPKDAKDKNGCSPVTLALRDECTGSFDVAMYLFNLGIFDEEERKKLLSLACERKKKEAVKTLVEYHNVKPTDMKGYSLLELAFRDDWDRHGIDVAFYLVTHGLGDTVSKCDILHKALWKCGRFDSVKELALEEDVQKEYYKTHQCTILHDVCNLEGSLSLVKYLVEEANIDPNTKNSISGKRAVDIATRRGNDEIVEYLQLKMKQTRGVEETQTIAGQKRDLGQDQASEIPAAKTVKHQ